MDWIGYHMGSAGDDNHHNNIAARGESGDAINVFNYASHPASNLHKSLPRKRV
jgi:hypothetical protein